MELAQKGIDKNIIEEVLDEMLCGDNELELAKKVFEKAIKKYGNIEDSDVKQKVIKYLLSKGFNYDMIEKVLKKE